MECEGPRDNWEVINDVFYEKIKVYDMDLEWVNKDFSMNNVLMALAANGGMIAVTLDVKNISKNINMHSVKIYNAAGLLFSDISLKYERLVIVALGWNEKEELVLITDIGSVYVYDIDGTVLSHVSAKSSIQDIKVIDAKVFPTYNGSRTGVAVLTSSYRFHTMSDISQENAYFRDMAHIPAMDHPPSSWEVLPLERSVEIITSVNNKLYIVDPAGCSELFPRRSNLLHGSIVEMSVCYKTLDIALFSADGILWVGSSDLQNIYMEFDTEMPNRPSQMEWCGIFDCMKTTSAAIVLSWEASSCYKIIGISPEVECSEQFLETPIFLFNEVDGVRAISLTTHELIRRVPESLVNVFRVGSTQPGALLYDAQREFDAESHKATDYVQVINDKNMMETAVDQCIRAAGCATTIATQKALISAASYGRGYLENDNPKSFVEMCKLLRVMNDVAKYRFGIPLTYQQLHELTIMGLVKRLVRMRLYYLAIPIVNYMNISGGQKLVLSHWAMDRVKRSVESDQDIANAIIAKVGVGEDISYADVAREATKHGKTNLAIKLLDYETRSAEQVPALMRMQKLDIALEKAIDSGDVDLLHTVLVTMETKLSSRDFSSILKDYKVAESWYSKWCSMTDQGKLVDHYYTQDMFFESALLSIQQMGMVLGTDSRVKSLEKIQSYFSKSISEVEVKLTKEEIMLAKRQGALQGKVDSISGLTLNDTIDLLIQRSFFSEADSVRKEFKVSDRKFWWLKVRALAATRNWVELEKFANGKKAPIGYAPFVEECIKNKNKAEATKYITRVPKEQQVQFYIDIDMPEQAAMVAKSAKSPDLLNTVLNAVGPHNKVLAETISSFKNSL